MSRLHQLLPEEFVRYDRCYERVLSMGQDPFFFAEWPQKKEDGLKQAAQFGFDFVNDFTKIFGLVRKIDLIHRND